MPLQEVQYIDDAMLLEWNQHPSDFSLFHLIDVREPSEYNAEHIPGSLNVPLKDIASTNFDSFRGKPPLFYCLSGNRTKLFKELLDKTPFEEKYCLDGGIKQWKRCGLPTEK